MTDSALDEVCLIRPCANYLALGNHAKARQSAYRSLFNEVLETDVIAKIQHFVNTGLVLGTETFRNQVASMHN